MADGLEVDTTGLRNAAASSETAAEALESGGGNPVPLQPSGSGAAAVDAALSRVRQRQADRITNQAANLARGSAAYASTDADGAEAVSSVSV